MAVYANPGPFEETQHGTIGHLMNTIKDITHELETLKRTNEQCFKLAQDVIKSNEFFVERTKIIHGWMIFMATDEFAFDEDVRVFIKSTMVPLLETMLNMKKGE